MARRIGELIMQARQFTRIAPALTGIAVHEQSGRPDQSEHGNAHDTPPATTTIAIATSSIGMILPLRDACGRDSKRILLNGGHGSIIRATDGLGVKPYSAVATAEVAIEIEQPAGSFAMSSAWQLALTSLPLVQ